MLNLPIYPTESFIACLFHCVITTLSIFIVYHWQILIKKSTKEIVDKMMINKYKLKMLLFSVKLFLAVLYISGIVMEAVSYHYRYVLDRSFPFMQLFKAGFLCFYVIDILSIAYFILILYYLRNDEHFKHMN